MWVIILPLSSVISMDRIHQYNVNCPKSDWMQPSTTQTASNPSSYLTGISFTSGSLAVTTPTRAPTFASSCTSMIVPSAGWKMGGSSMSDTLTRTMVWSREGAQVHEAGVNVLINRLHHDVVRALVLKVQLLENKTRPQCSLLTLMARGYNYNNTNEWVCKCCSTDSSENMYPMI